MTLPLDAKFSAKHRLAYAGIVGNGRTCALVDRRGRIGWMCVPTFAQFPVFAKLLDPVHGGYLEIGIRTREATFWSGDHGKFEQRYLPRTNILETSWVLPDSLITVQDAMPWGKNYMIRDIRTEKVYGLQAVLVRLRPTFPTPSQTRFLTSQQGIAFEEARCPAHGLLECQSENAESALYHLDPHEVVYEFTPRADRVTLTLSYDETFGKQRRLDSVRRCARSDAAWLNHAVRLSLPDADFTRAFERSLLTLRLLTYDPTGALLAAATASFPSEPGGQHNWDYRYCWVRDGCYTARAFDQAGCSREAERIYRFLLDRESDGQWNSPLWAIEPGYTTEEEHVPGLRGPGGETPIRIGNAAAKQRQHDSPGNVISGVYAHVQLTGTTELAETYWQNLLRAADWCCDHWAEPEAGIWEKRDHLRAWVHGRAMCWAALRQAIRLTELLQKPVPARWERAAQQIAHALLETGWSESRGAFLRACAEPSIYDVSALSLLLQDLVSPTEPRMQSTVEKLAQNLAHGPAFRRDEDDKRFPFYLATFWMIRALLLSGDYDRAYAHFRAVISGMTDLDLMAEYFDPSTGRQYGNFPQAFSHEELVRTANAMLWKLDEGRLVLFPAIPNGWLVPGNAMSVSNIPLGATRGSILLKAKAHILDFKTSGTGNRQVVVPPRYLETGKRVRLNGIWQN